MNIIEQIFTFYDKLISPLSASQQAGISLLVILIIVWQVYLFIKSGHWIFIAVLIILMPSTWPAVKHVGEYAWVILTMLFNRAQDLIG